MALTGNTVQSTYLDLVQLEKSGAGLPSHAGKEAAVYDGSGAQIISRTAVRHWLDPHPDAAAFAETWEFSTTGDMTQGQLETAGWTFTDCSAEVSGGILWLTNAASGTIWPRASLNCSFAGDFDVMVHRVNLRWGTADINSGLKLGGIGVGDSVNNVLHQCFCQYSSTRGYRISYTDGTLSTGGSSSTTGAFFLPPNVARIQRISGALKLTAGMGDGFSSLADAVTTIGWSSEGTVTDADTMDRLLVLNGHTAAGENINSAVEGYYFIRRFQ